MAAKLTVTDLLEEILSKIFLFIDFQERPKLFYVCSRFNAAAKHPALWRRCEFSFFGREDPRKISSFCNFFTKFKFIRVMSITDDCFYSSKPLDNKSINSFNQLFKKLKHLICLNLGTILGDFVLPSSLQHFTGKLSRDGCIKDKFPFPKIERLHLEAFLYTRVAKAVSSMLLKYQSTLPALYLKICSFEEEWIPLMENCLNLKELGIEITYHMIPNLNTLFASSLSLRLEILYVNNIGPLGSFDNIVFPELKVLTIDTIADLMTTIPVIKRMPKLQKFHFYGEVRNPNYENFSSVVKNCETLRYLLIRFNNYLLQAKDEFSKILPELNKGVSEENQWRLLSEKYISDNFHRPSFNCNCLKPTKDSMDLSKHKQLHLLNV